MESKIEARKILFYQKSQSHLRYAEDLHKQTIHKFFLLSSFFILLLSTIYVFLCLSINQLFIIYLSFFPFNFREGAWFEWLFVSPNVWELNR